MVEARVGERVWASGFAEEDPAYRETLRRHAVAQVKAAAPLPVDPDASTADEQILNAVAERKEEVDAAGARAKEHLKALETREVETARLAKPWSFIRLALVHAGLLLLGAAVIIQLGALMAPALAQTVVQPSLTQVLGGNAPQYVLQLSFMLAVSVAAGLVGAPLGTVLITQGRIPWYVKALFVLGELGFSAAFGIVRLGDKFTFQALAISGFEFTNLLVYTTGLIAVSGELAKNQARAEARRVAEQLQNATGDQYARALDDRTVGEERYRAEVAVVKGREDANRRLPAVRELMTSSVDVGYDTTLSALLDQRTRNPADDAMSAALSRILEPSARRKWNGEGKDQ